MPMRQIACGAAPVMSRPSNAHAAAVGAQMAGQEIEQGRLAGAVRTDHRGDALRRHVEADARDRGEAVERLADVADLKHRAASARAAMPGLQRADDAAGKHEQQHDQDRAEDERPVLRVGGDLLVEQDQHGGADGRAPEAAEAAEDRHDQHLGRFRPVGEVGEYAAIEDAEQRAREAGECAGHDECGELVAAHVHADELRALRVLADRGQDAAERRADDAPQQRKCDGRPARAPPGNSGRRRAGRRAAGMTAIQSRSG